jgi:hypothetical protein
MIDTHLKEDMQDEIQQFEVTNVTALSISMVGT